MNERIKLLDKQAKLWAIDNTNFPISSHIPAGYTKKFAELIVEEVYDYILNATFDDEPWPSRKDVKQHFGVEE